MTAETFSKRIASICFWLGIVSLVSSAYFFLIAPIEYVALAVVLFGAAIALQLVGAVLARHSRPNREEE